ncbi:hypothetical protein CEXT_513091 [Caerostris extrusa]|uniref:Secreted protein n=1 Tax=Caerostris extrusa TaxID=172846 RepID=A0AAV4PPW3_CAEEX|nr:hypothetical protein CEXT_513091 [Caerostris extrusa]
MPILGCIVLLEMPLLEMHCTCGECHSWSCIVHLKDATLGGVYWRMPILGYCTLGRYHSWRCIVFAENAILGGVLYSWDASLGGFPS